MEVSILFFGALAQQTGQKEARFALPPGALFGDLLDEIGIRFGNRISGYFWDTETNTFKPGVRVVADGRFLESRAAPLKDGEEIRVFPAIGGG